MIPVARPDLSGNEKAYVTDCVETSWVSSVGAYIERFEREFAAYCGTRFAVATNNGTTALHLALAALGVGPGDEVVVPALTYIASANAVTYCGAVPVFADVDPDTLCLDVADVERRLTARTKAVMPVHLYGRPADMNPLLRLAEARGFAVVEDAAEAHGATVDGRRVGSIGDVATFSFFGNKILTTGEGGAVTTDDEALAARLRLLRGQGMDPQRRYWFPVVGFNYRMTNIAAAMGCAQLERVDSMLAARRAVEARYAARLADVPGVRLLGTHPGTTAVPWLVTILTDLAQADRDRLLALMAQEGVETRPVFYPMHVMPAHERPDESFPVAEAAGASGVSLPTYVGLREDEVDQVVESLALSLDTVRGRVRDRA